LGGANIFRRVVLISCTWSELPDDVIGRVRGIRRCLRRSVARPGLRPVLPGTVAAAACSCVCAVGQPFSRRRPCSGCASCRIQELEAVETETTGSPRAVADSVEELESKVAMLDAEIEWCVVPDGMHPVDLYFRDDQYKTLRVALRASGQSYRQVLSRIRRRVFTFFSQVEAQLAVGQVNSDIFERNREYVDSRLGVIAPDVLAMFASAYHRLAEGDVEATSQASTSCRRVLKAMADSLYPSDSVPVVCSDGKTRIMTDDKFISRLIQFVFEAMGKHASANLVMAEIQSLGPRIEKLHDLSNKGVHAVVTRTEADQCAIHTYLLVGDLLRIKDGVSAALSHARTA
jgi:hypothetical protein